MFKSGMNIWVCNRRKEIGKEMLLKIGQRLCNDSLAVDGLEFQAFKQWKQIHPQLNFEQWRFEQLFFRLLSSENWKKKFNS